MANSPIPSSDARDLSRLIASLRPGRPADMTGLWGASAALLLSELARRHDSCLLIIALNERRAAGLREDIEFFLKEPVPLYPPLEMQPAGETDKRAILSERLSLLTALASPAPPSCLVVPASGLFAPVPATDDLQHAALLFEIGMTLDVAEMQKKMVAAGFHASPMVTTPGEFSLRGDILDIYPMAFEKPIRIELFDIEIESIRRIDLESQRSIERLDRISIPLPRLSREEGWTSLLDHLPENGIRVLFEPHEVEERVAALNRDLEPPCPNPGEVSQWIENHPVIRIHKVALEEPGALEYKALPARGEGRMFKDLGPSLDKLREQCGKIRILCWNDGEATRLKEVMEEQGIRLGGPVRIVLGRLTEGFQLPDWGWCYINHHELLQRLPVRRERKTRKIKARALDSFTELKTKDLVVHRVHGIAQFDGIARMEREGGQEDFLKLLFHEETLLYVPASKMHLVEKYIGGEGHMPKLDRLGGKRFARRKEKVGQALRDLAAELLELQAVREEEQGVAYSEDDELMILFEASFAYQDTEDQSTAMTDIKADMEKRKPMDRLLCGDVGFGKTELAIRSAFKAVSLGKQVAVLVPTTILTQQHFETFRNRLADYPVTVEALSRFRHKRKQTEIIEAAKAGQVDILIGTHRLLSLDVGFKDLGLLIIDEEQRFGVVHKEKLKRLKRTVDVLTMTATPIPRTLHMAMVGLRDISSLEVPPDGRMAINTRVVYKNDEVIRNALQAEVRRGGQVFYLHNRVKTIERETRKVQSLAPKARIAFAHGQMGERDLERVMSRFIQGKIDVLVSTTIIESGIDLPRVNTILIDRADAFGLADLHQLRGRVGRGSVRAHAILLIPRKPLPDIALRRLKAIEELSQLGAGFNIALKDLEIRGAGNILGPEQHGHIVAVGYELYCRLLKETILSMQGKSRGFAMKEVDLDIRVDAYLPAEYIPDEGTRMKLLRELGHRQDAQGLEALREEFRDRFGRLPEPVLNLLDLCLVRSLMAECGIKRIALVQGKSFLMVDLFDETQFGLTQPFKVEELRFIDPLKAHLHPPSRVRGSKGLLKFLKSQLMHPLKSL